MKLFFLFILIIVNTSIFSQSDIKSTNKVRFGFTVLTGPLDGERGTSALIEVIPAIKLKSYSFGIGTGLDYYYIRTVPVFLQIKKAFRETKNSVYVYADAGFDYPWPSISNKATQGNMDLFNGHRLAGGIGYQIPLKKNLMLLLSGGYSYKQVKQNVQGWVTIYDPRVDWFDYTQHYNYKLSRLVFTIGLSF